MARHKRNTRVKRRKGGNIYATTMRAQRTMEHIVADVNEVIATLAELSTELQRSIQPGHPNAEQLAMAHAENRQARRVHQNGPGMAPQNAPRNANENAPGIAPRNAPRNANENAPGIAPRNAPRNANGNAPRGPVINEWPHNPQHAYPWVFEGRHYVRAGDYIYEVPPPNADFAEVYVGRYLPAERRINRNAEEPDWPNE